MAQRAMSLVRSFGSDKEEGQGMVEYGLIIALVAVVAIAGLIILGPKLSTLFTSLGSSV
jgi:pilus assembly protein Flp/PilA